MREMPCLSGSHTTPYFAYLEERKYFYHMNIYLDFLILKDPKVEYEIIDCSVNSW